MSFKLVECCALINDSNWKEYKVYYLSKMSQNGKDNVSSFCSQEELNEHINICTIEECKNKFHNYQKPYIFKIEGDNRGYQITNL